MPDHLHDQFFAFGLVVIAEEGIIRLNFEFVLQQTFNCELISPLDWAPCTLLLAAEMTLVPVASHIFEDQSVGHLQNIVIIFLLDAWETKVKAFLDVGGATSTEWVPTAKRFKVLMDLWKASGRGKKNDDAKQWSRFKAAQDQFFASKNADLEKRDVTMAANLAKREELLTLIEAVLPITDIKESRKVLNEHLRSWEKIGMTHRDKRAALDTRVAKVESVIKEAEADVWRKTDPAAKKRAEEVVAQLTESIANYEKAAAKFAASGNTKKSEEAAESATARKVWLAEAEKGLAEFN